MVIRRLALSIAVVLGMGAAGFLSGTANAASGGGGSGGSGQFKNLKPVKAPSPCTNDPGVSDSEIKVGAILPQSGPSAPSFAASEDGMRARIDQANATGELGKRKITLTVADDGGDPARNVTAAQQLVEQNGVFGIIENSLAADASAKYLNQKGVPVTGWHLGLASFGTYPNMFGWRNSQPPDPATTFTNRDVLVLKMLGASKIALVGANTSNSSTFINQIEQAVKMTPGMKVVYKTTDVSVSQRDFTAEAQKIKDSGADGLYTGMDFLQNVALSAALKQDNYSVKATVYPGGYDSRVTSLPGIDGVYFGLEVIPFEQNPPSYTAYKTAMQKAGKFFQGEIPYIGWLSADTFIEGIKAAGTSCPTRKGFIANLRLEKNWTAHGAFAPIDFTTIFGRPFYCTYYVQVQNGAFVPTFGGKPVCASEVISGKKVTKLTAAQQAQG
ncbi:MAG TPA: ABC transporter substrate-binding protein [Acidimicrobiia bacterium]|nr:ABC transporter substrate-binding protein [Acidimicrobiia bacterium]